MILALENFMEGDCSLAEGKYICCYCPCNYLYLSSSHLKKYYVQHQTIENI